MSVLQVTGTSNSLPPAWSNQATMAEGCCSDTWYDLYQKLAVTVWCTPDDGCDRHPKHVE